MRIINSFILVGIAVWLASLTAAAYASTSIQPNWYQVEILLFSHQNAENFEDTAKETEETVTSLIPPNASTTPEQAQAFQSLPSRFFQLNTEANRLERSPLYHIIGHTAWVQPFQPQRVQKSWVVLPYSYPYTKLRVQLARYFTVTLHAEQTSRENYASEAPTIMLHQTRRMRSKQINYFDHPYWGALVKIVPIQHTSQTNREE